MTNAEETPSNLNKKKRKKRNIGESNYSEKEVIIMHEDERQKDLEVNQLKERNGILNERLNERETAFDETLQRLADADCPAFKRNENKALIEQIEKSIQEQINNMQKNLKKY